MSNSYNYGIINGGTGSFGSLQYTSDEVGGTKEIMATGSTGPKMQNLMSVSASAGVEAGASTLGSVKVSDLTSTRIVFAGANGELQDDSDLTFATDTLTATKIGAFEAAGAINFANQDMSNVDIDSGAIDGTTIGAASAAAATFTTLTATTSNLGSLGSNVDHANYNSTNVDIDSGAIDGTTIGASSQSSVKATTLSGSSTLDVDGATKLNGSVVVKSGETLRTDTIDCNGGAIDGAVIGASSQAAGSFTSMTATSADVNGAADLSSTLYVGGAASFAGALSLSGALTAKGDVDLGDATSDTITATGRFDSDLVPSTDGARDLGSSTLEWKDLYIDGVAYIDSLQADQLGAALDANSQAITNINVDSGAIDGATIGASSHASGKFTTLTATGNGSISGSLHVLGNIDVEGNINSVTKTETTLEVVDKLVIVASGSNASNTNGGGFQFGGFKDTDDVASMLYDADNAALDFNIGGTTEVRLQDGVFRPESDNDVDLGASGGEFKDLYLDGVAYIDDLRADALGAALNCASQAMTNINVDSGAIDGTTIGASSQSSVKATTLSGSSTLDLDGNAQFNGSLTVKNGQTFTTNTADINGGAIDGTVIGASSVAAGSFAAVVGTTATFSSTLTANGHVDLGSDSSDTLSVNALIDTDLIPSTDDARDLGSSAKQWKDLYVDGVAYIDQLGTDGDKIAAVYATNVYTGDFHMKNERGDWTLFEESDHLRIRNNKTGQNFKMGMIPLEEEE
jgi:hypothetical protein